MATMEAIKVVVALREAAVFEPFAAVVAFHESASVTVFPRAAFREPRAAHSRALECAATAFAARHCDGMTTTAAGTAAATVATSTSPTSAPAADKRDEAVMTCAESALEVRRASRLSCPQRQRG
jgi:hypothetical protein